MRRLSIAGALVALLGLSFAGSAHACSCATMAPGEALRQADAAIVATLVKVVPRNRQRADFRYRVERVRKGGRAHGGIGRTISVRSATRSSACGLPRRTGRRYGLLLTWADGRWTGGLCGLVAPRKLGAAKPKKCAS